MNQGSSSMLWRIQKIVKLWKLAWYQMFFLTYIWLPLTLSLLVSSVACSLSHSKWNRMWMTTAVALCLLAFVASAEDKKLSSHANTLADNSANLAFRLAIWFKMRAQDKLAKLLLKSFPAFWNLSAIFLENAINVFFYSFTPACTTRWLRTKIQTTLLFLLLLWRPLWGWLRSVVRPPLPPRWKLSSVLTNSRTSTCMQACQSSSLW